MRRGDTLVVLDLTRLGRDTRELLAIVEDDQHANGRHRVPTLDRSGQPQPHARIAEEDGLAVASVSVADHR